MTSNYSRIKIHLLVKKANLLLDKIRLNSTLKTSPLHSHVIFFVRANKQKNIYPIVFEFRVWSKTFWTRALGFRTTKLRRNPPGKLSSFKIQCTKTLYQNNFNYIAFFFTLFKGYKLKLLNFLGRVVQRPVSANPRLNFNPGLFFFSSKAFSQKNFSILFRVGNNQVVDKKN